MGFGGGAPGVPCLFLVTRGMMPCPPWALSRFEAPEDAGQPGYCFMYDGYAFSS